MHSVSETSRRPRNTSSGPSKKCPHLDKEVCTNKISLWPRVSRCNTERISLVVIGRHSCRTILRILRFRIECPCIWLTAKSDLGEVCSRQFRKAAFSNRPFKNGKGLRMLYPFGERLNLSGQRKRCPRPRLIVSQ